MAVKVLMVCLGNICRSPLAEGILKKKLEEKKIDGLVDSAGLINYHRGSQPDHRSIAVARKYSIDITTQQSRPFDKSDLQKFDYIFAMDSSNYENLLEYATTDEESDKIFMLLNFAGLGEKRSVPDPYYGNLTDFENVYQLLDKACSLVAEKLKVQSSQFDLA